MNTQYHILNGDVLKKLFPEEIVGKCIIVRECLVDGPVDTQSLNELFELRARFICDNYDGVSEQDYYDKTVREFKDILNIDEGIDVNLWFEDDLFCQVNFWFVVYLLCIGQKKNRVYLVRSQKHSRYSFGSLSNFELISCYKNRILLCDTDQIAALWKLYKKNDIEQLLKYAEDLEFEFPFILEAVHAHRDRISNEGILDRPSRTILQIISDLETDEFDIVFNEFRERESIYGFGDVQVRKLFDKVQSSNLK